MNADKIIVVIGFPKSGNTWVSRIIRQLYDGVIYNELHNKSESVDDSEPQGANNVLIVKRHDADLRGVQDFLKRQNIISNDISYVYVKRNIRDVVLSGFSFNYPRLHKHRASFLLKPFVAYETKTLAKSWVGPFWVRWYRKLFKIKNNFDQIPGNWENHVKNWISIDGVMHLSYESLIDDSLSNIKDISNKLGIQKNESFIEEVNELQSFKTKKNMFNKNNDKINSQFLRKGSYGYWADELPASTALFIQNKYGDYQK